MIDISDRIKPFHGYQICPICGGEVEYAGISSGHIIFPGASTAQIYICKECDYQGSAVIEVDTLEEVKKMRKYLKSHKGENVIPADNAASAFGYPKEYAWLWRALLVLIVISVAIPTIGFLLKFDIAAVMAFLFWIVVIAMIIALVMRKILKK